MRKPSVLRQLLNDGHVATIAPSSRFLVRRVAGKIDFSRDLVLVELGPGDGVITRELLKRMSEKSVLLVLETNLVFADYLRSWGDPRLIVENKDARMVREVLGEKGLEQVDHIISGIPFSRIPSQIAKGIVEASKSVLSGSFITYQFLPRVKKYLTGCFGSVEVEYEVRNLPPLFVYEAR